MIGEPVLCQPDPSKGCCACCGLFNFRDISRARLAAFLTVGAGRSDELLRRDDQTDAGEKTGVRDFTSFICPHQGFLEEGRPGCLLHPLHRGVPLRHRSFFGEKICGGFLCPAHSLYGPAQRRHIVDLIDDWYYYSIALIDPGSVLWLFQQIESRCGTDTRSDALMRRILRVFLEIHADALQQSTGPVFFYSLAEYRAGNYGFCLAGDNPSLEGEKREVCGALQRIC